MIAGQPSNRLLALEDITHDRTNLKILILHTPLPLKLTSLPLFTQLIKLDLAYNRLAALPHLGSLRHLQFLFLHNNHLNITSLMNIFEFQGVPSPLSASVKWFTFWGNKDVALARHYLANSTSIIAFDTTLISPEETSPSVLPISDQPTNSLSSDLSDILERAEIDSPSKDEDDYVWDIWSDLAVLRARYQQQYPALKIQKVWRGYRLRAKFERYAQQQRHMLEQKAAFFQIWKVHTRRWIKLRALIDSAEKGEGGEKLTQMTRKDIERRLVELARQAKARILHKKAGTLNESRFYSVLRNNFQLMQDLYSFLELEQA
jgi:hypothetical protein